MKTKIFFTVLTTLSLNMLWGQWVEVITGEAFPISFEIIDCPNESTCYIASDYKLMRSADGGDTWVDRTSNIPISVGSAIFAAVECSNPDTCLCVYGNTIYKTTDAGQTWTSVSPDMGSLNFKMIDAQYGYSNIGDYQFAKTTDFGNTWTSFSYLSGIPFNVQDYGYSFDFITPEIGVMAFHSPSRNARELYKTTNGGLNWAKVFDSVNPPITYIPWGLDMVTTQVGYMTTVQGDVYKTIDGAETWVYKTKLDGGLDVEFIDENNGYVSATGKMFKTTDGGENWIEELTPNNSAIPEIEIVNYEVVYASTYYENIFKISNAGLIAAIFDLENRQIGKVYPNPVNDVIEIDLGQNYPNAEFQLVNLLGNEIFTQQLNQGKTTIQRNNIVSGVYLYQIMQGQAVIGTGKLVFS